MEIFLIRHGQTDYNLYHLHQDPQSHLNDVGKAQAARLVDKVRGLKPTHLISSDLPRAVETVRVLSRELLLTPEIVPAFAELYRPKYMLGVRHASFATVRYLWQWFLRQDDSYWTALGGESQQQYFSRLQAAQLYLASLPPDARVVVVSHSFFITTFVRQLCLTKLPNFLQIIWLLLRVRRLDNSSISHVSYNPSQAGCAWTVRSFDDDAHVLPS